MPTAEDGFSSVCRQERKKEKKIKDSRQPIERFFFPSLPLRDRILLT